MIIDFSQNETIKKIRSLEKEIAKLLEERPEYKEWFLNMKKEIDKRAGDNTQNRLVISNIVMMEHMAKLNEKLIELMKLVKK